MIKLKGHSSLEWFGVLLLPGNVRLAKYLLEDNCKIIFSNSKHELQLDVLSWEQKNTLMDKGT